MVLDRKLVIVGGGVAGLTAALSAREKNAEAKITILSKETYPPYSRPYLPYVIRETLSCPEEIAICSPQFLEDKKIRLLRGLEVYSIDNRKRMIKARELNTSKIRHFDYHALILATGGQDIVPQIKGTELNNVFTFRTFDDALKISQKVKLNKSAIVVGAGPIALSVAEALVKRGVKTKIVIRSRALRTLIEPDLSRDLQRRIKEAGVEALTSAEIEEIGGSRSVEYVKIFDKKIPASMLIFATGVRPSIELAKETETKLGEYGIKVDEHLRTSNPEIYAAGDCIEATDSITKKHTYFPIGSVAAEAGRIAGVNAVGGDERSDGFLRVQGDRLFGVDVTSIGHSSATANDIGIKANVIDIKLASLMRNSYCFGEKYRVKAKIVTDEKERIIGAQTLGERFAAHDRYVLFRAIKEKMGLYEFLDFSTKV